MNNSVNDLKVMEEGEVGKECAQTPKLLPSLTGKTVVPEISGTTRTSSFVSKSENAIIGPPKGSEFIGNDGHCQTNGLHRCKTMGSEKVVCVFCEADKTHSTTTFI